MALLYLMLQLLLSREEVLYLSLVLCVGKLLLKRGKSIVANLGKAFFFPSS